MNLNQIVYDASSACRLGDGSSPALEDSHHVDTLRPFFEQLKTEAYHRGYADGQNSARVTSARVTSAHHPAGLSFREQLVLELVKFEIDPDADRDRLFDGLILTADAIIAKMGAKS